MNARRKHDQTTHKKLQSRNMLFKEKIEALTSGLMDQDCNLIRLMVG